MRILIYGAGAVGSYLGAHLAMAGHHVILLGREPLAQAIATEGLQLRATGDQLTIRDIRAVGALDAALEGGPAFDWIALTLKSYDTVAAIFDLQALLPEPPPIISFQNGLGNEESLRDAFGPQRVVAGAILGAVSMPQPGVVIEGRRLRLAVASDSPAAPLIESALRGTRLRIEAAGDSTSLKWSRLLVEIPGNATCAILDMMPKEVFSHPELVDVERKALLEAQAVMQLKGVRAINLRQARADRLLRAAARMPRPFFRRLLRKQIEVPRDHAPPSLLSALRSRVRRTEAAWLNGGIAQAARSIDRLAPLNHALALIVSDIAAGRVTWETYRGKPEMLLASIRVAEGAQSQRPGNPANSG